MNKNILIILIFFLSNILLYSQCKWSVIDSLWYDHDNDGIGMGNTFSDIDCIDSNNCIALSNMNKVWPWIIKTTDGGHSWDTVLTNYEFYMPRMERCVYVSENFCIATAEWGNYWISRDNGFTWEKGKIETENGYNLMRANFLDEETGVVQTFIEVFITTDGGQSWTRKKIPENSGSEILKVSYDIQLIDEKTIYVLMRDKSEGRKYYLMLSNDMGETWENKYICDIETANIQRIFFINETTGWAAGLRSVSQNINRDIIYKTTDGGDSWQLQLDTLRSWGNDYSGLNNIEFYDENFGIAWGKWWRLWKTWDGGETWVFDHEMAERPSPIYPKDYCVVSPTCIYSVTGGREILKYTDEAVSVQEALIQKEDFLIYPNPASRGKNINFSFSLPSEGKAEIEIFDSYGKKAASYRVYFKSGKNTIQLQPDGSFSTGAYYTVIKSRGKILHREMFVVM